MGNCCTKRRRKLSMVLLGLDAAGKTSILYKLATGEPAAYTAPTVGFNVRTVNGRACELNTWDVGGQQKIRPLWRHYLADADVLLFVVDAVDEDRFYEAKEELQKIVEADLSKPKKSKPLPIAVLANKQDMGGARTGAELTVELGLRELLAARPWGVFETQATAEPGAADGLDRVIDWVVHTVTGLAIPQPDPLDGERSEAEPLRGHASRTATLSEHSLDHLDALAPAPAPAAQSSPSVRLAVPTSRSHSRQPSHAQQAPAPAPSSLAPAPDSRMQRNRKLSSGSYSAFSDDLARDPADVACDVDSDEAPLAR